MQNNEVIRIDSAATLEALNRSEIDVQISTAKRYPRTITESLDRIEKIATVNQKTAAECFYALPRGGKTIEGPSVRLAEIVATCWGNLRVQAQIIGNDGRIITARGVCHDLETNVAFSSEVRRRITDRNGRTYDEDMQIVTGNAASAIALRNAIFKCVPQAVIATAAERIKQTAIGKSDDDIPERRDKCLAFYAKQGVTEDMILFFLEVSNIEEIGPEELFKLTAVRNAVKEGTTTYKQSLIDPFEASKRTKVAEKKMTAAQSRVAEAMKSTTQEIVPEDTDLPMFGE